MTVLEQALEGTKSVAILGHVRPDGDCLGSTLGLYNYLLASYPDIQAAVYLEEASSKFAYLKGYDEIHHETDDKEYELCICLDSSDEERLGSRPPRTRPAALSSRPRARAGRGSRVRAKSNAGCPRTRRARRRPPDSNAPAAGPACSRSSGRNSRRLSLRARRTAP